MRRLVLATLTLVLLSLPTIAHEGHGDEAAPVAAALPRTEAHSELFEIVAVLQPGGAMAIYLDRFADNAPVEGAVMLAMALGIALASILIIRWITQPLRRLADAADGIGRDLAARPLPLDGPREVRHAAAAFNAMQDRITRLVEDRTEALAAMSHDLRTPLSRLRLRAGFLPEGEAREKIEADMAEMEAMIGRTMDYIREGRDAEPKRPADLAAILQTLASDAADAGQDVSYDGPARAVLPLRHLAAKRALSNLVENAVLHGAGPVRLTIRDEGRCLVAEVADSGPGIAAEDRARAVAPFSQLDPARRRGGSGLGLAIAQRFAEASGGALTLALAPGGGLLVRLTLPKASV